MNDGGNAVLHSFGLFHPLIRQDFSIAENVPKVRDNPCLDAGICCAQFVYLPLAFHAVDELRTSTLCENVT
ncbi:hypothetical protein I7I53_02826 [Histoplasma capsulatum var. duboisii H88]|uniref:Uncharacterized protein n=1 Tax=Ajellomyces capsulatus (strain H88) TaxID=544711 RepID=A0A8A1LL44_AJEC8|nr:hypothetical protein I7I53_02826 [Histoplasma capsulatum var. duboisii H88]